MADYKTVSPRERPCVSGLLKYQQALQIVQQPNNTSLMLYRHIMTTPISNRCRLRWQYLLRALVLPGLFAGLAATAWAQGGSPHTEAILFTCHLNPDCLADTVMALDDSAAHNGFLPWRIVWGVVSPADSGCADTLGGIIANNARRLYTYFRYPDQWQRIAGSASVMRADSDAYDDLLLMLWGRSAAGADTAVSVAVFGQHALNTLDTIDIAAIQGVQYTPIYARCLMIGTDFIDGRLRDFSGDTSYVLRELPSSGDTVPPQGTVAASVGAPGPDRPTVLLFPNPTNGKTRIEAYPLAPARYSITVATTGGDVVAVYQADVDGQQRLRCALDFARLASGAYLVRLARSGPGDAATIGTYGITVAR